MSKCEITLSYSELQSVAIYAFRYALGRRTYAVSDMSDFLIRHKDDLSEQSKQVIVRDIERAFDTNCYGMECDKQEWMKVLAEILNE